jgi:hypothetical protein
VLLGAAGEVCRGVDDEALEDVCVFGQELLDRPDVLLKDRRGRLEGFAGMVGELQALTARARYALTD